MVTFQAFTISCPNANETRFTAPLTFLWSDFRKQPPPTLRTVHDSALLRVFVLGSLLALGGCSGGAVAQSDGPPKWFAHPDRAYSDQRYLTATAAAPSDQAARNRAFGNLARVFSADIQTSQELLDEYREVRGNEDNVDTQRETVMITKSDVGADQKLLNAEVLERARVGGTHYVLVGMERRETLQIYAQRIKENRQKIDQYRSTAETVSHPLHRLAALQKALVLAKVNERLRRQRSIVAGGGGTVSSSSIRPDLEKAVRAAQTECSVVVKGEVPSPLRTQVSAALESAGFRVVDRSSEALLAATAQYEERPTLPGRDDAHFFQWTLAIKLTDLMHSQAVETFTVERRTGAPSETSAKRRARNEARTAIEDKFPLFLTQTLLHVDSP